MHIKCDFKKKIKTLSLLSKLRENTHLVSVEKGTLLADCVNTAPSVNVNLALVLADSARFRLHGRITLSFPPPDPLAQIGSCTSQMGQIAIVSFHNSNPKVIECFNVESRILCMVHIPAERSPEPGPATEPGTTAGSTLGIPTVCLGTEEGR